MAESITRAECDIRVESLKDDIVEVKVRAKDDRKRLVSIENKVWGLILLGMTSLGGIIAILAKA